MTPGDGPVPVSGPCPVCGAEDWRPAGPLPQLWLWLYEGGKLRRGLVLCGRCDHREQSRSWRFSYAERPVWRRRAELPWRLLQVLRQNRSEDPVPMTYVLAVGAGTLAAVGLRGRARPWVPPVAAVSATWLWSLSSVWRGPATVEPLRDEILGVLQPERAEERFHRRQERLFRETDLPLYGVSGWRGPRMVGGYGWSGRDLSSAGLRHVSGWGRDEGAHVEVETRRDDPLDPAVTAVEPDAHELAGAVLPLPEPEQDARPFFEERHRVAEELAGRGSDPAEIPVDGVPTAFRVLAEGRPGQRPRASGVTPCRCWPSDCRCRGSHWSGCRT